MTTLDPFAHDDGAYVLAALSTEERAAFEEHLATCPACTDRVRELTALPALLAGVPAGAYVEVPEEPPETLLPSLLRHIRAERRRRQWFTSGLAALAAACVIALTVIAWPAAQSSAPDTRSARPQAMSAVNTAGHTALQATVALTDVKWGTQIKLSCRYYSINTPHVAYDLVVYDISNHAHPAGSWTVIPGGVTSFTGGTALPRDQISRVEIAVGDQPILRLTL